MGVSRGSRRRQAFGELPKPKTPGFPTLVQVADDLEDVRIAAVILDANTPLSATHVEPLLQWGTGAGTAARRLSGVASDIFARVGAFSHLGCQLVRAGTMAEFNSDNLIIDNVWVWHADHDDCSGFVMAYGADMMDYKFKSDKCHSQHGITVNGNNVIAYGVAVEHIVDGHMLQWNGESGQLYFFQAELPYHNRNPVEKGYAAYSVAPYVYKHFAVGLGAYIIDKMPAQVAFQVSEYCDLRNVFSVVINAPDNLFANQVCQKHMSGTQTCFEPTHCAWMRCYTATVPRKKSSFEQLPAWRLPPTNLLPAPQYREPVVDEKELWSQMPEGGIWQRTVAPHWKALTGLSAFALVLLALPFQRRSDCQPYVSSQPEEPRRFAAELGLGPADEAGLLEGDAREVLRFEENSP
ncbi:unnamed protein product [Effrenium voratum]|nr:unnamed protein product [Effrenium voratum]